MTNEEIIASIMASDIDGKEGIIAAIKAAVANAYSEGYDAGVCDAVLNGTAY